VTLALCLTWGFNQVAIKYAIGEIPPLTQAAVRSVVAALFVAGYARLRGIRLLERDGTLLAGIAPIHSTKRPMPP
jgi:drug/metabolite transporter (DMT)-like permease